MMLLLVAGCEMFPEDEPIAPQEGAVPTIAAKLVGDTKFEVTVTPAQGTAYYGYLISDKKVDVTGTGLVSVSYEGVVAGNADAREDATSAVQIVLDGKNVTVNSGKPAELAAAVQPATKYYIYAAGNSEQGLASAVVMDSVWTTDATVPDMSKAEVAATDSTVVITMNTVVLRGTGKVTYSAYDAYGKVVAQDIQVTDKDKLLAVDGKTVTFSTPDSITIGGKKVPTPGGVIIALNWEAKAFTNASPTNTKDIEALKSVVGSETLDPLTLFEREGKYGSGVVYRVPVKPWSFAYPTVENTVKGKKGLRSTANDTIDVAAAPAKFVSRTKISYPSDDPSCLITAIAQAGRDTDSETCLPADALFEEEDTALVLNNLDAPISGGLFNITIPEGAYYDVYGNPNAEFVSNKNFVYSYGLQLTAIRGTYNVSADTEDNEYNKEAYSTLFPNATTVTIEPLPKEENYGGLPCNIVIKGLMYPGSELKAVFYEEIAQVRIPAGQVIETDVKGTFDGYYDMTQKPGADGKYPLKTFTYKVGFDASGHAPVDLDVVLGANQSVMGVNVYSYEYSEFNSEWNAVLYDGQTVVADPWYKVTNTKMTKANN